MTPQATEPAFLGSSIPATGDRPQCVRTACVLSNQLNQVQQALKRLVNPSSVILTPVSSHLSGVQSQLRDV